MRLERDVEARDRYDRLLAYVIRDDDDVFVNRLLVEEGFAESIAVPAQHDPPGRARPGRGGAPAPTGEGLWATCGGTDAPLAPG